MLKNKNKSGQVEVLLFVIFAIVSCTIALFSFSQSEDTLEQEINNVESVGRVLEKKHILEDLIFVSSEKAVLGSEDFEKYGSLNEIQIKREFVRRFLPFHETNSLEEYLSNFSEKVHAGNFTVRVSGRDVLFLFPDVLIKQVFYDHEGDLDLIVFYKKDLEVSINANRLKSSF
jgi:hypothetical protein